MCAAACHPRALRGPHAFRFTCCLARYLTQDRLSKCHVVLLPSTQDAHLIPCLPQPPMPEPVFDTETDPAVTANLRSRVHVMPNPCTFTVNGVVVGATTSDFLGHVQRCGLFR